MRNTTIAAGVVLAAAALMSGCDQTPEWAIKQKEEFNRPLREACGLPCEEITERIVAAEARLLDRYTDPISGPSNIRWDTPRYYGFSMTGATGYSVLKLYQIRQRKCGVAIPEDWWEKIVAEAKRQLRAKRNR